MKSTPGVGGDTPVAVDARLVLALRTKAPDSARELPAGRCTVICPSMSPTPCAPSAGVGNWNSPWRRTRIERAVPGTSALLSVQTMCVVSFVPAPTAYVSGLTNVQRRPSQCIPIGALPDRGPRPQ